MANYIQKGNTIDYINTGNAKINAGDVVVIGTRIGVAGCDIAVGAVGAVALTGVFEFDKASGAIAVGQGVYWDAENKQITTTASGNAPAGFCIAAVQSGDATVRVCLTEARQAANCAKAAGTAPTKAEFDAVIDALVAAGLMAAAE